VFTAADRDRTRQYVIDMARGDGRIVAGAELGSAVAGLADRWSDLDLTFALAAGVEPFAVLDSWAGQLANEHGAVQLFDLQSVATTYRVFLFPNNLQVDVSVTPLAIAQMGPKFRMLFGDAVESVQAPELNPREVFGLAVHHVLRTRVCIERHRYWAALYALGELRNETLTLACLTRGLAPRYARAVDELPEGVLEMAADTVARSVEPSELLRALTHGVELLLSVASGPIADAAVLAPQLYELTRAELR